MKINEPIETVVLSENDRGSSVKSEDTHNDDLWEIETNQPYDTRGFSTNDAQSTTVMYSVACKLDNRKKALQSGTITRH